MKFKQFAALPYRMRDNDVEILLITTRKKRRRSVPKSWPIMDNTPQQAVTREAYEEAGVHETIGNKRIGMFRKRRQKKEPERALMERASPVNRTPGQRVAHEQR